MALEISSTASMYVKVPVYATKNGLPLNPTADVVDMAFLTSEQAAPTSGQWNVASWETAGTTLNPVYLVRCLVGTGGVVLAVGSYQVWVKIIDNPEVVIMPAGELEITP